MEQRGKRKAARAGEAPEDAWRATMDPLGPGRLERGQSLVGDVRKARSDAGQLCRVPASVSWTADARPVEPGPAPALFPFLSPSLDVFLLPALADVAAAGSSPSFDGPARSPPELGGPTGEGWGCAKARWAVRRPSEVEGPGAPAADLVLSLARGSQILVAWERAELQCPVTWPAILAEMEVGIAGAYPSGDRGQQAAVAGAAREEPPRMRDTPEFAEARKLPGPSCPAGLLRRQVPVGEARQRAVVSRWALTGRTFCLSRQLLAEEDQVSSHHVLACRPLLALWLPIRLCPSPSAARSSF